MLLHIPCKGHSESESRSVVSDSLRPCGLYSPWNSPGQNSGVGSLSLLQGIFPTRGSNSGLPHCRRILYQLSHQASPKGHITSHLIDGPVFFFLRVFQKLYRLKVLSFPGGSAGKESACNVGDLGSIPVLGRSPGGGHGKPLQYSCLENPMDRGAWWATELRRVRHG